MIVETLFIGILLALLYTEVMEIYPGGIIVPAFLALYLDRPVRVLATILIGCFTLLTYKALSKYFILFGKRRFVLMVLAGGLWAQAWFLAIPPLFSGPLEFKAIGMIIPGLLANNLERQRFFPTIASLLTVSIATFILAEAIRALF